MLKHVAADPELPDSPVIMTTAWPLADHADEQTYAHLVGKLTKPTSATDLIRVVKKRFG